MRDLKRGDKGMFQAKGLYARKVRSIRLTYQSWINLSKAAIAKNLPSRADLLESIYFEPTEQSQSGGYTIEEIEQVIQNILDDPKVTRDGKDRSAIRRGLAALLAALK